MVKENRVRSLSNCGCFKSDMGKRFGEKVTDRKQDADAVGPELIHTDGTFSVQPLIKH